jgi:hypothetical protein
MFRLFIDLETGDDRYRERVNYGMWVGSGMRKGAEVVYEYVTMLHCHERANMCKCISYLLGLGRRSARSISSTKWLLPYQDTRIREYL